MPHYKCAACRIRLHVSAKPAELVGDLCPECGLLLEPVLELAELIGFRSIRTVDSAADAVRSNSHRRIADGVDDFLTRRATTLERDRIDAESWLNDDEPRAAAVALPPPADPLTSATTQTRSYQQ